MLKKYIGTAAFYKRVLALTIPIMIQNGITNFVNMLDNLMVGSVGTVEMTGVAVSNQLIFVFNLCIFGALSGAGIFGAQFYGMKDNEGLRHTFRFKFIVVLLLTLAGIAILFFGGEPLINLYLKGEGDPADAAASLKFAKEYMNIMLIGFIPYGIAQCYSSTLRESDQATLPMAAGVSAVAVNLVLNYLLIFGKFGCPRLGVNGAAIATVISRFVELAIVAVWTHAHSAKNPFIIGVYKSMYLPAKLARQIILKGMPLMVNEALWSAGMATLNQCYSFKGLNVVAANNICQTFFNVFSVAFLAVGMAIGIILGQILGTDDSEGARDAARKMIALSVFISVIIAVCFALTAEFIPNLYKTTDEVRIMATRLMQIMAIAMPLDAFANATYFTLRSGGKTTITMAFDSGFVWCIAVPTALILTRLTPLGILPVFAICNGINIFKCILGLVFVKKGIWIRNIIK